MLIEAKQLITWANFKLRIDDSTKWYMLKPETVLENEKHKLFQGHLDTNRSANIDLKPVEVIVNKNKRTCQAVEFAVTADHGVKINESIGPCQRTKRKKANKL